MCFAPHHRALFRHLNLQKWSESLVFLTFWLRNVLRATHFFDIWTSKSGPNTSKCASRHNGLHFFDIVTAKSGPDLVCFVHFHFEMCFAPQQRVAVSTSQLPKVVRRWGVLCILTSKCASRHNGVHFFDISTSKRAPRPDRQIDR